MLEERLIINQNQKMSPGQLVSAPLSVAEGPGEAGIGPRRGCPDRIVGGACIPLRGWYPEA
ncbi:hypothetical protein SAMN05216387_10731 [Nitrosovibrio tenuis]|uniref:Uncharacterized protein n=1 Tax=Nitrosovibrio tenuis TaxID=1233 RepID=A0A1H7NK01_9PROT|nr:hypothetical protein SAMN05216387_10731 [Nitrosovibrio tenuis]